MFPLKYPPKISERKKRGFVFDDFDALDFQWQVKKPKEIEHYQKVYRAEVVAKVDIDDENIAAFLQNVINKICSTNKGVIKMFVLRMRFIKV